MVHWRILKALVRRKSLSLRRHIDHMRDNERVIAVKEIEEKTARSWEELQEFLFFDDWAKELQRNRSPYVYRGLSCSGYDLSTTLNRHGGAHLERHLLRNFKKYSQLTYAPRNDWEWLTLAQHHGLPTRLLDWTYSPFVALHFATVDHSKFDHDSVIWAVNYLDTISSLPDHMREIISTEGSHVFTVDMLECASPSVSSFMSKHSIAFPTFLEPPSMDARIINQFAVFSFMSDPKVVMSDWLTKVDVRCFKIVIPKRLLWLVRDRLDQANITERVLFPGLDGLASWLRRHYKDTRQD